MLEEGCFVLLKCLVHMVLDTCFLQTYADFIRFLIYFIPHTIHVSYIYHSLPTHLVDLYGKLFECYGYVRMLCSESILFLQSQLVFFRGLTKIATFDMIWYFSIAPVIPDASFLLNKSHHSARCNFPEPQDKQTWGHTAWDSLPTISRVPRFYPLGTHQWYINSQRF